MSNRELRKTDIPQGTLDITMRLEQRGLVRGKWGVTENNRKGRFYAITAVGRRELASEKADWERTVSIMHTLLGNLQ